MNRTTPRPSITNTASVPSPTPYSIAAVATSLAVPELRYVLDADLGGEAPCYLTGMASMAIATTGMLMPAVFVLTQPDTAALTLCGARRPR